MAGPRASAGGTSFTAPLLIERNTLSSAATTTTIEVSGTATFAGDLNVLGVVSAPTVVVGSDITVGETIRANAIIATGAANFGGTFTVSGSADFQNHINLQGAVTTTAFSDVQAGMVIHNFLSNSVSANASADSKRQMIALKGRVGIVDLGAFVTTAFEASANAALVIVASSPGISGATKIAKVAVSAARHYDVPRISAFAWEGNAFATANSFFSNSAVRIQAYISAVGTQPDTGEVGRMYVSYVTWKKSAN